LPAKFRFKAGDTARRTFQALRIAVNKELEVIEKGLREAFEILAPGGRMAAISFHSLEDRIVKKYFNELARGCICPPEFPVCKCGHEPSARVLTPKPITAGLRETETNTRSHSAKLRAIGKIDPAP
jgi:16S rRNA (cytosine1402-N4)-methyltransferase